jgi:gliding motility-associated-like protein
LRKLYYLLFYIAISAPSFGGGLHKATFTRNDLFQTGYFLRNVPGLITDYNGQPIRYFADHDGVCVFLTDAGPVYKLIKADEKAKKEIYEEWDRKKKLEIENDGARENVEDEKPGIPTFHSFTTVHWIGANPRPLIEAVDKNTGTYNYIAGTSSANKGDIHSIVTEGFKKIVYHDMYPGIDVEYTFPDKGGIEYDLIVHPGADASVIKMEYGGAARSIETGADGSITIHTQTGDIQEHAPVSRTADGRPVASAFNVQGTRVSFALPAGYDHSSTLTIDPWVNVLTQLTVRNLGCDADYDVPGNLYVYGAGGTNVMDVSNYQKIAKFNAAGTFLWVFNGSVPVVGWTTVGSAGAYNYLGNMKVDRINETVYVGCAFDPNGTQAVRLDNNGVYNNFISNVNGTFREIWSFIQNCATGAIIPLGGGTNSNLNMAVITPSTGGVVINNFTGIPYTTTGGGFFSSTVTTGWGQDVVSGAEDSLENLFVVMASNGTPQISNAMYQINSTYNGNLWGPVATGFNSFVEAANMPLYDNINGGSSNNYNALAVNMSYLYYYDGTNLAAYNKANGARVGTATTVTGANPLYQGGIAVDRCNNVYVGQVGQILTYSFNGATFTQGVPISLGGSFTGAAVMDVRYNALNNLLYVTGDGFAGTYVAVPSRSCIVGLPYSDTLKTISLVSAPCSYPEAVINVTPGQTIPFNPQFTYVWQDSLGNILQQDGPGVALTDTFVPTSTGKYTIQVELNENCGLNSDLTTFYINSRDSLTPSPDTTVCVNQPVTLTAIPCAPGGAYLWQPGGATTSSVTVTPGSSTTYSVTYTPLSGQGSPITDSIHVTVVNATTVSVNNDTVCNGQPATLTATPTIPGGSYSWTPGGATTQSITVTTAANSTTSYTVTYTTLHCGTATATGTITTGPNAGPDQNITCYPASNTVTMGATGAGTWTACAGNGTATITNPSSPTTTITGFSGVGTYNFVWTAGACTDTAAVFVTNTPMVIDSTIQNDSCYGYNDGQISLVVTPPSANYTYTWSNSGSITDTIKGLAPGAYSVTVTNPSTGCSATGGPYTITGPGTDSLSITPLDTTIALGDTIQLSSTVMGGFPAGTYSWTPANGLSCTNCPNPILVPTVADTSITPYILTITYNNGCVVSDTAYIQAKAFNLLAVPDAFTPNGDNVNDTFRILALSVKEFRLTIYNRWGGLLFESTDINNGWDGTYQGKPQPEGTYLFFFTATHLNGKTESKEGTLTLFR